MTARFKECFADLQDPRIERNRWYPLMEILLRVICATLSGTQGWEAMAYQLSVSRTGRKMVDLSTPAKL